MNEIENLELKISKFLRYGVIFAGIVIFIGWISMFKFTNTFYTFKFYDKLPLIDIIPFYVYRERWGMLVAYAGLVILISLPIIRVFLTAFLFIKQKEYILATIAIVVSIALIFSMFLGIEL
ncbi:MAG: DUF1634 domain-containing protein [Bacteriovoracaceae bacterium]|nr:DUF1634 domain-containing protein [Bacteriovoracaceae bacterium]